MKSKILVAFLLLITTGCSIFSPAKKTDPDGITASNKFISKIQILIPGSKLPNTDDIINEINKKTSIALNSEISIELSTWEELNKKIQTAMSSGHLDIIVDSFSNYKQMVSEGKYAPLDDSLTKYGQQILKVRPKEMWDSNKISGEIMGIPIGYTFSPRYGQWFIRNDLREKLGFQAIKTNDDLIKFLYAVKDNETGITVSATDNNYTYFPGQNRILLESKGKIRPTPALEYSYVLYFNGNDGKVYNMFDDQNQIIWNELVNARKLYYDNVTFQSNLSVFVPEKLGLMSSGKLAAYFGGMDNKTLESLRNGLKQKIPGAEIEVYSEPNPSENYIMSFKATNMVCVPTTSKNKESAIRFLNWANYKENYDLIVHGFEGIDWAAVGTDKYKALKDNYALQPLFSLVGNPDNYRLSNNLSETYVTEFKKYQNPKNFTVDILSGFEFDTKNISKDLQECMNLHNTKYSLILNGYSDPEKSWEPFKDSAYDVVKKIQVELQRQIDIYLKTNSKK